jgi:hypothetical protein
MEDFKQKGKKLQENFVVHIENIFHKLDRLGVGFATSTYLDF